MANDKQMADSAAATHRVSLTDEEMDLVTRYRRLNPADEKVIRLILDRLERSAMD